MFSSYFSISPHFIRIFLHIPSYFPRISSDLTKSQQGNPKISLALTLYLSVQTLRFRNKKNMKKYEENMQENEIIR